MMRKSLVYISLLLVCCFFLGCSGRELTDEQRNMVNMLSDADLSEAEFNAIIGRVINGKIKSINCSDTDRGINYDLKSDVMWMIEDDGKVKIFSFDEICVGDDLLEYSCDGYMLSSETYTCSDGCSDGACLVLEADGCVDSDGFNYGIKGVTSYNGKKVEDYCIDANTLYEGACCPEGFCENTQVKCGTGCVDGACVDDSPGCKDSDGMDYFVKGHVIYTSDGESIVLEDSCNLDDVVVENYCADGKNQIDSYECPDGCVDGVCIEKKMDCEDSDGGQDYYTAGMTVGSLFQNPNVFVSMEDICDPDTGELIERYCEDNLVHWINFECINGCLDGACVSD